MTSRSWVGTPGHVYEANGNPLSAPQAAATPAGQIEDRAHATHRPHPGILRLVADLRERLASPRPSRRAPPAPDPSVPLRDERERQLADAVLATSEGQRFVRELREQSTDQLEAVALNAAVHAAQARVSRLEVERDCEFACPPTKRREFSLQSLSREIPAAHRALAEAIAARSRAMGERLHRQSVKAARFRVPA